MPSAILYSLCTWFKPTIDTLCARNLPFHYRWRMLIFMQPMLLITYGLVGLPWLWRKRPFTVEFLPVGRGRHVRALIYKSQGQGRRRASAAGDGDERRLRPLHLDLHGGAFMGGIPESDARFCELVAAETGAVVVSATYRTAPKDAYPAAIDDVDAVVRYLREHAAARWGANPELMTVSGFSAGGNLAMAATQQEGAHGSARTAIKAVMAYYAVMDLRLSPWEKPKPAGVDFPKFDPAKPLLPLMDAYATAARKDNLDNPRLSPFVAAVETLPLDILLNVAAIDILVQEQLTFIQRIKDELARDQLNNGDRRIEAKVWEKGFHGWVELPDAAVGPSKMEALMYGVEFLKEVYKKHDFGWQRAE